MVLSRTMSGLVSIIMPAYNSSEYINKSIDSVFQQVYSNWELIIIDDCSLDETPQIVKPYLADPRVSFIQLSQNSGSPAVPRNIGLDNARGEFIAFLDSDDTWNADKLKRQVEIAMCNKNYGIFCSAYSLVNTHGGYIKSYIPPVYVEYSELLKNNSIGCLTAFLRSEVVGTNRFPICGHEDYAFWLMLTRNGAPVFGIQEDLANYTLVDGSVSSDKKKLFRFFWNIYRNEEGFGFLRSTYFCLRYFINVVWFKYK